MTLTQIRYFLAVCKCNTISKAAQNQHISQPAISAAIKELEGELGGALFQRSNSGLVLTKIGELFQSQAEEFIAHYERMCGLVQRALQESSGFSLGVTPMVGSAVVPEIFRAFIQGNPDAAASVREGGNDELIQMIIDGRLDLAIIAKRISIPEMEQLWIRNWRLKFCIRKDHPLAANETMTIEKIGNSPLVMLPEGFSQSAAINDAFGRYGLVPRVVYRTAQLSMLERFISAGVAGGFLEEDLANQLPDVVSYTLEELPENGQYLIWKKGHYMPHAGKVFRQCVRNMLGQF